MINKFLNFYHGNKEYRERNSKLLNELQKKYWSNEYNKIKQADSVRRFFQVNPDRKKRLSLLAIEQWVNPELRKWRARMTSTQWTDAFRAKRKIAYDRTYLQKALAVLHGIYQSKGAVDIDMYNKMRKERGDKSIIRYDTICKRFFGGDVKKLEEAITNYNHKIIKIIKLKKRFDVYDLEIKDTHNFALASGVFVHNSSKQGRDRRYQAILPLRGKILNVERARLDKMLASKEIKALVIALGAAIAEEFDVNKLRYHRIIIATDADVDGSHIRTLLLTLFYRYFPIIIQSGYLYIAQPPLYKIQIGRAVEYAYTEEGKNFVIEEMKKRAPINAKIKAKKGKAEGEEIGEVVSDDEIVSTEVRDEEGKIRGVNIQRYKGLGEMNPIELWATTMNPENRVLKQVNIEDAKEADKIFDILMGAEVAPRKRFIQTHAKTVQNLDI
jgi:DNA gyrase subunit B